MMARAWGVALAGIAVICFAGPARAAGTEVVCEFSDTRFTEISGMTTSLLHPHTLWIHNDSSGGPFIYAVDDRTCRTLATIRIKGAKARDYEAISMGYIFSFWIIKNLREFLYLFL